MVHVCAMLCVTGRPCQFPKKQHCTREASSALKSLQLWQTENKAITAHTSYNMGNIKSVSLLLESYQPMPGTEQLGGRGQKQVRNMGFNRRRKTFPEGEGWTSPVEDESPCGAGEKVGLAKTSQAGLTVAEQLNNFTEQPDKPPHIITGLQEIRHVCAPICL